jgi:hypothetical protein
MQIQVALEQALVPLVFGDVAVDEERGGTIVSTEDVFAYLARVLRPAQVLLAGREAGVLTHYPDGVIIPHIRPDEPVGAAGAAHTVDVTGGMASKVREMQALAAAVPGLTVRIFSGELPGMVHATLVGDSHPGTTIVLFEPDHRDAELFLANTFSYAERRALAEHAYQQTRRMLRARRSVLALQLAPHGVTLVDAVLDDARRSLFFKRRRTRVRRPSARAVQRLEDLLDDLDLALARRAA